MDDDTRVDVVQYRSGAVKAVPAGEGADVVASQRRSQPLYRDRMVLGAAGLGVVGSGLWFVLTMLYSVLIVRNLLLGILVTLLGFGFAALFVGVVAAWRWSRAGGAELLDGGVSLRAARGQWEAAPVSAVADDSTSEPTAAREPEHASEG